MTIDPMLARSEYIRCHLRFPSAHSDGNYLMFLRDIKIILRERRILSADREKVGKPKANNIIIVLQAQERLGYR